MRQIQSKSLEDLIELIHAADRLGLEWTADRDHATMKADDDGGADVEIVEYSIKVHGIW